MFEKSGERGVGSINVTDPADVEYWCRELNCTHFELDMAVREVGTEPRRVRDYIAVHYRSVHS